MPRSWRPRVLAVLRARPRLAKSDLAACVEALRAARRPWAERRDTTWRAETFEISNRNANSVCSGLVGPCLTVETEERIRAPGAAYRRR